MEVIFSSATSTYTRVLGILLSYRGYSQLTSIVNSVVILKNSKASRHCLFTRSGSFSYFFIIFGPIAPVWFLEGPRWWSDPARHGAGKWFIVAPSVSPKLPYSSLSVLI